MTTTMPIDIRAEKPKPLRDIGKDLPDEPSYDCLIGWARFGRRNRNTGVMVFLEVIRMPYGLATTEEAYWRFIEALNAGAE